jgi:soluble lytic murein transglycosylase-like protein
MARATPSGQNHFSLDERRGLVVPPNRNHSAIPLFDQNTDHSIVPTKLRAAVARSGGQGRPSGRRASASPLMAASTMARLWSLAAIVRIVAVFASSMQLSGEARAKRVLFLTAQQAAGPPTNPFGAFVAEASMRFTVPEHWICAVNRVESSGRVRARSRKRNHGSGADHARDMDRLARSIWSRPRSL